MRRRREPSSTERAREVADRVRRELDELPRTDAASLRAVRRRLSAALSEESGDFVIRVARSLLDGGLLGMNVVAYELVHYHPRARAAIDEGALRKLGVSMRTWGDVDTFACYVAGPAWREGLVPDAEIHRWARSKSSTWRRAALVSTVPLNVKSQGGEGDPERTLAVCGLLTSDRDDLVVKALSWALRALVPRDREAVRGFLRAHRDDLAARVVREVENKLETGLKNARRRRRSS